jgi:hypothetical protein
MTTLQWMQMNKELMFLLLVASMPVIALSISMAVSRPDRNTK